MGNTLDLRVRKTYQALLSAFLDLLEKKQFEKITVSEICEAAMIRRATFYSHFSDKYELFRFLLVAIRDSFLDSNSEDLHKKTGVDFYIMIVHQLLDFLDDNEKIAKAIITNDMSLSLMNMISEQIVDDLTANFIKDAENGKELIFPPELMAQVFAGALLSMAKWWISHKDEVDRTEIEHNIVEVLCKLYY